MRLGSDHPLACQLPPYSSSGINEGYEIPLPRKPPRRKFPEGCSNQSFSSQSSAPEYGLPSPKYWNVEVQPSPSLASPYHQTNFMTRSNSVSSNLPLLHKSTTAALTTTETRNEAFVQDHDDDTVQYTALDCPEYNQYQAPGPGGSDLAAVANNSCVVSATSPSSESPGYKYSYHSIPTTPSTAAALPSVNHFQINHLEIDYQRHHNHHHRVASPLNNTQRFRRQTIDTCGSG